jgi:hypothetical protein
MELHGGRLPRSVKPGRYRVYYVARVEVADGVKADASAFSARIYDGPSGKYIAERMVSASEVASGYHPHLVGTVELNAYSRLWMGHARDEGVKAVWFDRAFLIPVKWSP